MLGGISYLRGKQSWHVKTLCSMPWVLHLVQVLNLMEQRLFDYRSFHAL